MKRTRLKPVSDKRRARFPAREAAMQVVRERDRFCQFWLRLVVWADKSGAVYFPARKSVDGAALLRLAREAFPVPVPECDGELDGHEPLHRSQGGDETDPEQAVLICRVHHDFIHQHPVEAKLLDL